MPSQLDLSDLAMVECRLLSLGDPAPAFQGALPPVPTSQPTSWQVGLAL